MDTNLGIIVTFSQKKYTAIGKKQALRSLVGERQYKHTSNLSK